MSRTRTPRRLGRDGFFQAPESIRWGLGVWGLGFAIMIAADGHLGFRDFTGILVAASCLASLRLTTPQTLVFNIVGLLAFNWLFVPPRYDLDIHHKQDVALLLMVFASGALISLLTSRLRELLQAERHVADETEDQLRLSEQLLEQHSPENKFKVLQHWVSELGISPLHGLISPHWPYRPALHAHTAVVLNKPHKTVIRGLIASCNEISEQGPLTGRHESSSLLYLPLKSGGRAWGSVAYAAPVGLTLRQQLQQMGQVKRWCAVLANDLERWYTQSTLDRVQQEHRSQQLRSTLLAAIAHDFRTPLATMLTAVDHLRHRQQPLPVADAQTLAITLSDEIHHLQKMSENTLQLARLEASSPPVPMQWESLQEICGTVARQFRKAYPTRTLTVTLPAEPLLMECNAVLMAQALDNLLDNAANYSAADQAVELQLAEEGDQRVLRVLDRGPGIPDAIKPRVFELFARGADLGLPEDVSRHRTGFGLGLALCKAVADAHHSTLRISNRDGGGSIFVWRLPSPSNAPEGLPE
ncbi:ATP-binding protein [Limnobacter humi]|uniref:histidine kinase n=1 Tax=Limnobacter humi TaxID=1778671 RepID=A0ABT1WC11_9BURK|nr:ATP-binding protein [Limnobacter humi]MCQ8895045.1 ATP-binding protein [Limnobacter humi]